jgi:hypothetical protein
MPIEIPWLGMEKAKKLQCAIHYILEKNNDMLSKVV